MKKIALSISFILIAQLGFAQQHSLDWNSMKPEKRKEVIQKMKPQERLSLLKEFREKMIISELKVSPDAEAAFKNVYSEYQNTQNDIKSKFKSNEDYDNMSDDQATQQLNHSFDVGQELLDNRKNFVPKFMKVISPQQVLKMYQTEGKMRSKILDRKQDGTSNSRTKSTRP
ncbi:hypothetical protein FNJ88_06860 [Chryseobacterium sp. SNU WT5]|uniref:hypothetical protein n=1 Tax=Chryseobacterium sp. SNU WT5 TaxID=2594269 RepID=UPI00117D68DE|nr:hypothetical protein [Chryseobacterium sp. SNU WT5]QDP85298.1 hypothetical protein FNJ88_06860 [Chryseobacterium sp. SNU WT5]